MSTVSFRISESLHQRVRELVKKEGISINQLIKSVLGQKIAALLTKEYLEERAKRGSRDKFEKALSKVKDIEPEDRIQQNDISDKYPTLVEELNYSFFRGTLSCTKDGFLKIAYRCFKAY